jgi:hypothetical protein
MRGRQTDRFVDDILADRPPENFPASSADAAVLRVAIALRAGQPGADHPNEQFVQGLHRQLAALAYREDPPVSFLQVGSKPPRTANTSERRVPIRVVRRRLAMAGAAAAAVILAIGTIATSAGVQHRSPAPAIHQTASADEVHTGVLLSADGRPLGRMYVYKGDSSWVFMNVYSEGMAGVYTCELQLVNGTTVPVGTLVLRNGSGVFARIVSVDVTGVRAARLVTPAGTTIASATFS